MKEKPIAIRIGRGLLEIAAAKKQAVPEWFEDALGLAVAVDRGEIFQSIGGEFQKLKITDIKPFTEESYLKRHRDFTIIPDAYRDFKNIAGNFKDLTLRIISLHIAAENLNLYFFDGERYNKIEFISEPREN